MATANPHSPTAAQALSAPPPRSRRWRKVLFVFLAVGGLAALFRAPLVGYSGTAAAYGARVACSCRFVGGRGLADCRNDFEAGMGLVTLSEDVAEKSVTAHYPLLASETATYREGWGCVLEKRGG